LSRLYEWVFSRHGSKFPIGLFVPFPAAYLAVRDFIQTEGELPTSIEWIAVKDITEDAFQP